MVLVKLEGNKKKLIDFLMEGEKPFYEVAEYFKSLPKKEGGGISKQAVSKMVHTLNPAGLISFRTNEYGEKMVILNEKKLITKYASDRFIPHIIMITVSLPVMFIVSLFTSIWFFYGSASIIAPIFIYISYLIFRTSKMKDYFYEKSEQPRLTGG